MPEYLPPIQLPTSLAEKAISLRSSANDPWAALAQNLGQDLQKGVAAYKSAQANKPLTPDQIAQIQAGKVPQGLTREQGLSLAEKQAQQRTMMGRQQVPNTPAFTAIAKANGYDISGEQFLSQREADMYSKLAQNSQKASLKPVTAYENLDGLVDGIHQFVTSGGREGTDPKDLPGYGGKNSLKAQALEAINKKYPGDFKALAAAERGNKAELRGQGTTAANAATMKVNLDSAHSGFSAVMDVAKPLAAKMSKGEIGLYNAAVQRGETEFNNPDAIALNTYMDMAASNYARITKGGTGSAALSDQDRNEAKKILSNKLDEGGIGAVQKALEVEYKGRLAGLPGGTKKEKSSPSEKGASEADPLGLGL